tara:strand:+ start:4990 stop:5586 length:597 start_codon:yes stop_codon:yes gene_type:complete
MPGIKTSLYDGCIALSEAVELDLSGIGPVFANKTLINGAVNRGVKILTTDGTHSTVNFSAGDKLVDALSNRAIGTIASVDSNTQITLQRGTLIPIADNAVLSKWMKFEIVAIQTIEAAILDILVPVTNHWVGTLAADGGTYAAHADFGIEATAGSGAALTTAGAFGVGVTIEGRWKYVSATTGDTVLCYLKAAASQTF